MMAKFVDNITKKFTKIILVDKAKVLGLDENVAKRLNFKGEYLSFAHLPQANVIYVGIHWELREKTCDPFAKVDYFELGAATWRQLEKYNIHDLSIANMSSVKLTSEDIGRFTLGLFQAHWNFDRYKKTEKKSELSIGITTASGSIFSKKEQSGVLKLHQAMILAREMIEETPQNLNPATISTIIKQNFKTTGSPVKIEIWDEKTLKQKGMNAVLTVGQASQHPPVMAHLSLLPRGKVKKRVCLVGKGITYDSGGLDVKTEGHMRSMKMDMAGAATMMAVAYAISQIGLDSVEVHWISAFAENMIAGDSYKADDIITTFSGQTVEVYNTDAEGRLTLADTLAYSTLLQPDYIIDAATLTGAAIAAVSPYYTAMMGNDDKLIEDLFATFLKEGELVVHTRLPEVLRQQVKGTISDLNNTSKLNRVAGHLTAGLFLSHFVDQRKFSNPSLKLTKKKAYSWVHLDIAGSAYNDGQNSLLTKGATGHAIRSIVSWLLSIDK